ncbi:hypothetical protein V1511DRAFT_507689 [Dipodascopsis uninucleata]
MDMSSLSSNLPHSMDSSGGKGSNGHASLEDESQLLGSFKAAAVAVTKLYREANKDISRARERGYMDAIDDMLAVLTEGGNVYEWALRKKSGVPNEVPFSGDEMRQDENRTNGNSMDDRKDENVDTTGGTGENVTCRGRRTHIAGDAENGPVSGTDFASYIANGEFTFRSDIQLDQSQPLPSRESIAKNTRDFLMMTPDDVLFSAVSAQLEEEQRIQEENNRLQEQQANGLKRRLTMQNEPIDHTDVRQNIKRFRY